MVEFNLCPLQDRVLFHNLKLVFKSFQIYPYMYEENEDFFLHELPNKKLQTKTSKLLPMLNLEYSSLTLKFVTNK